MTALTDHKIIHTDRAQGTKQGQDFVIAYPSAAHSDLAEAVCALYYLPENYKLVVMADAADRADIMRLAEDVTIMDRVSFEGIATEMSDRATPFSFADVVLRDNDENFSSTIQRQINVAENHSPEALASAILKAARA